MGSVNVRKRGKVYQYQFEAASVDGKRKQITKSGFKTKKEAEIEGTKAYNEYNNTRSFVYSCDNVIFWLFRLLDGKLLWNKFEIQYDSSI